MWLFFFQVFFKPGSVSATIRYLTARYLLQIKIIQEYNMSSVKSVASVVYA